MRALFAVLFAAMSAFLAWGAYESVRDGRAWGFFIPGGRADRPIMFWSAVGVMIFGAFVSIYGAVAVLLDPN